MSIINKTNKSILSILESKTADSLQYYMKLIIEATVRKVVEASVKIMNHQKAENLEIQHIDTAIMSLGLRQVQIASVLFSQQQSQFITFEDELNQACKWFEKTKLPQINARWLTIDGHVPSVDQNKVMLRKHKQIQSQKQNYQFNIIHDNPINFLLPEQQQLFKYISHKLESQKQISIGPHWNISNLLPFVMNVLMNMGPSDNRVQFILQVVHSKGLSNALQFYIHNIFAFLLKYKGKYTWEVGLQISKLISSWQFKYPHFHNIFKQIQKDYPSKIMKLAYEVYFRIPPSIYVQDIENDLSRNVFGAKRFVELLNMCWLRFNYPKCQYHEFFTEGRAGLTPDYYLQSII